jgi:hypothetical protein
VPLEPISFKCDGCQQTSGGFLDFEYASTKHYRGRWWLFIEHEYTPGVANCKNCGKLNDVWPKHYEEQRWVKNEMK